MRCDAFVLADGAVTMNEISLSSYWGNTLSLAWQERTVSLWVDGYVKASDGGGAAFGSVFSGGLPSPGYTPAG